MRDILPFSRWLATGAVLGTMLVGGLPRLTAADDILDHARATLASSADAVVTIRCVLKIKFSFSGQKQDQEQKIEISALTVDASGLFVTSASQLDPTSRYQMMFSGAKKQQFSVDSEIKDLSVLLPDGTDNAADIIMTDTDLDLAFVRLKEKAEHLTTVPLDGPVKNCLPLDEVYVLARATKGANRTPLLALGRISCRVKGPQPYYLSDGSLAGYLGCPVYAADGSPLGLEVFKPPSADDGTDGGGGLASVAHQSFNGTVIRPIDQILDLAKQATAAVQTKNPVSH